MDMTNESTRSCDIAQVAKGKEIRNIQKTQTAEGKHWDHLESRVLQGQHGLGSSIVSGRVEASKFIKEVLLLCLKVRKDSSVYLNSFT